MQSASVSTDTQKRLPWKDCECGCHGWTLRLGPLFYWKMWFNDREGFLLRDGHGWSQGLKLGTFKTNEELRAFVCEDALPRLLDAEKKIKEALAAVS